MRLEIDDTAIPLHQQHENLSCRTVINEDIHVELLELLELYCELLLARFGLLDQM